MSALAIATGLGAALNTLGGLFTNRTNQREGQRHRDHELRMWQMTNDYNTPAAQMQRLREAGLNPHLVHGNANQAEQPNQTPDEPSQNPFDTLMPALSQIAAIRATNMEIAKKEAETENIRGQTANQDIMRRDYQLRENMSYFDQYIRERQLDLERSRFRQSEYLLPYQRDVKIAQALRDRSRAELFLEQAESSRVMTPAQVARIRQDMRFQSELHQYNLRSNRARATIDEFQSSDRMLQYMQEEIVARIQRTLNESDRATQRRFLGIDMERGSPFMELLQGRPPRRRP